MEHAIAIALLRVGGVVDIEVAIARAITVAGKRRIDPAHIAPAEGARLVPADGLERGGSVLEEGELARREVDRDVGRPPALGVDPTLQPAASLELVVVVREHACAG